MGMTKKQFIIASLQAKVDDDNHIRELSKAVMVTPWLWKMM